MGSSLSCPSSNHQHAGSRLPLRNAAGPDKSCSGNAISDSDMVDNAAKDAPPNISPVVTEFDDLKVTELGIALTSVMNICGSSENQAINVSSSDQDVSDGLDECSDQNEAESASLHTNVSEQFSCADVLQSSDEVHVFSSVQDSIRQLSTTMRAESSAESTTAKLISALKGSRAQCGLPVTKLSVKWAPDVYDPPITSESHTVKGQRRRNKPIKKEYSKHKNGKSKTVRSGGGEKKHASRSGGGEKKHASRSSNFVDPKTMRYGAAAKGMKAYDASGLPRIPVLDYMSPELKCGASFYMEPLGRLHLSVAEAS